jgi:hypothetical protein
LGENEEAQRPGRCNVAVIGPSSSSQGSWSRVVVVEREAVAEVPAGAVTGEVTGVDDLAAEAPGAEAAPARHYGTCSARVSRSERKKEGHKVS